MEVGYYQGVMLYSLGVKYAIEAYEWQGDITRMTLLYDKESETGYLYLASPKTTDQIEAWAEKQKTKEGVGEKWF